RRLWGGPAGGGVPRADQDVRGGAAPAAGRARAVGRGAAAARRDHAGRRWGPGGAGGTAGRRAAAGRGGRTRGRGYAAEGRDRVGRQDLRTTQTRGVPGGGDRLTAVSPGGGEDHDGQQYRSTQAQR